MPDFAVEMLRAVQHVFAAIGSDAVWTPAGGPAVTFRVIDSGASQDYSPVGPVTVHSPGMALEAMASVVAPNGLGQTGAIARGDQITVLGEARTVSADPEYIDPHRHVVLIDTRRT